MSTPDEVLGNLSAASIFNLNGVVAVVTGGGTGIGLMISTALMSNGAKVYIVGLDQKNLDSIASAYNDANHGRGKGRLIGIRGDIRLKDEAKRLAKEIKEREGHITILFNNAGIFEGGLTFPPAVSAPNTSASPASKETSADLFAERYLAITQENFNNTFATNTIGPYWMSAAFLPLLEAWKSTPGGAKFAPQIVMISSMNGWTKDLSTAGFGIPYAMSKSAIGHFTSSLAHELLPLGIRVNGIAPGFFITELTAPGTMDTAGVSHLELKETGMIPPERLPPFDIPCRQAPDTGVSLIGGTNRDMGSLALFLTANWYVNGETVLIDGGILLKHPSSY